ncbi:alpha/beta hydrolase [Pacificoceanicola onchidii]|uniref:alpha/beta hydrolase n=1 Tax=Pacificoceanicola onchidii TaxID=2562685 RepID=UPI0010A4E7E9|nr:alpha/beta hydrolase [Pacificoceanicola onchidii]
MQRFWDSQFKFSAILPGFGDALERMARDSATVTEQFAFEKAPYGPHPRQWVEWVSGTGPKDLLPVIIHGGYWRALEAENHRCMMPAFTGHGAAVGNIEYRLMPEVRLADLVADAQAGLHRLAERFPDTRFLLVGHSAGAHLALSAMTDSALRARTAGVLALSGVYDLAPVALSFLQAELRLTPSEIDTFSLRPSTDRPPTVFVNGSAETQEFLRGGALMASSGPAQWQLLEGADHMSLIGTACAQADHLLSQLLTMDTHT